MTDTPRPENARDGLPLVLRLAPEYRRCGSYLAVASVLLACAALCVQVNLAVRGKAEAVFIAVILGAACLVPALLTCRWRLALDRDGVRRRRFFRWDAWPWEAFATGRVRKGVYRDSYIDLAKPWWNRHLLLDFLANSDRDLVAGIIGRVWQPPRAVALPEEVRFGYGFRRRARLSPDGLLLFSPGREEGGNWYTWDSVQRLELTRLDHSRSDF